MLLFLAGAAAWFAGDDLLAQESAPQKTKSKRPGYTDTPRIPGSAWRVHDADRPAPPKVQPGPAPEKPLAPPEDAVVLFDGTSLEAWVGKDGKAAKWKLVDGAMEINKTGDIRTVQKFGSCQLHLEWRADPEDKGQGQQRSNSGVFLMGRYEVQILESHGSETYVDGQAASLYGQKPPYVNACRPAGEWQTYDILFTAPKFDDDGSLAAPAKVTVLHNGVLAQHDVAYLGATAHRRAPKYQAHEAEAQLRLQDHGDKVRFRNIWIRPIERPAQAPLKRK